MFYYTNINTNIYTTLLINLYNNKYTRLNKILYSLKQSLRLWN